MSYSTKSKIIKSTPQYKDDIFFGLSNEQKILKFLNTEIPNQFKKYENQFSLFDIFSDTIIGEIKTRRNSKDKYPTTMVGYNKMEVAEQNTNPLITYRFYFIFTDGTYYWDYKEDNYFINSGGRKDRGVAEIKQYCFIKKEDLILLTTSVKSIS